MAGLTDGTTKHHPRACASMVARASGMGGPLLLDEQRQTGCLSLTAPSASPSLSRQL